MTEPPIIDHDPRERRRSHWGWKVFQLCVWGVVAVLVLNTDNHATGVAVIGGGMVAWYSTAIVNGLLLGARRLLGLPTPPRPPRNVGQLDAWAREAGWKDKTLWGRSKVRDRQPPGPPIP